MDPTQTELPPPPRPVALYTPFADSGEFTAVSGQGPVTTAGGLLCRGGLGRDLTHEEVARAAELAMTNVLAVLQSRPGGMKRLESVLRVLIAVACTPDRGGQLQPVADRALAVLADAPHVGGSRPACTIIGVPALPLGIPVEIEALARVRMVAAAPARLPGT
ncbi:RidA family protein [Streptomyces sp. NPDC055400]